MRDSESSPNGHELGDKASRQDSVKDGNPSANSLPSFKLVQIFKREPCARDQEPQ